MTTPVDPKAPHGRGPDGTPNAPYGHNVDGTPRKSNRGARAGQKGNRRRTAQTTGPTGVVSSLTDQDRKGMLTELADMFFVTPLAGLSQVPFLARKMGAQQADALAGDAFILSQYMPAMADGAILWSKTKPGVLSWLDKLETAAPALIFSNALLQAAKAMLQNHLSPNPEIAAAGRTLAALRIQQLAKAMNNMAAQHQPQPDPDATHEFTAADFERAAYERNNMASAA